MGIAAGFMLVGHFSRMEYHTRCAEGPFPTSGREMALLVTLAYLLPPAHAYRACNGIRKQAMLKPRRRICQPMITIVVPVTGRSRCT